MFHTLQIPLCLSITLTIATGEPPHFRILAPEFVCPKDEEASSVNTDNTIITIRTHAGADLDMHWTVRWTPLPSPPQRFTLLLWRTTRELEKKLNGPQKEPYVYVIENEELLRGVNYKFNVTAANSAGEETTKSFHINNVKGDQLLENLEGQTDMLSIMLVGAQETYADVDFMLEALVTSCHPTQDYYEKIKTTLLYYFTNDWSEWEVVTLWVKSQPSCSKQALSDYIQVNTVVQFEWSAESSAGQRFDASPSGRLEVPAYSLTAGQVYLVTCRVVSHTSGDLITQNSLPITVLKRTFEVYINVDRMTVSVNTAFSLESLVLNHDYFGDSLTYQWKCTYGGNDCDFFKSTDSDTLYFENGLRSAGKFKVALTVSAHNYSATTEAVIVAVERISPVIQISPLPRILNEGTRTSLVANATNVTPSCSLTWYFASEEYLQSQKHVLNDSCEDCQHGEQLTETLTIYSLEENFLYYLTDFSNETEWRQATAELPAAAGRARFVVQCGCNLIVDCENQGTVHADVYFKLNGIPRANDVIVTPQTGTALETVFRISTLAVMDLNTPLYYTFYCQAGINSSLVLGSYAEHLAVETFLPYMEDGTEVWVEVCDVLGACSHSSIKVVDLLTGDGAKAAALLEEARAHIRRCELLQLQKVSVAAAVTYKNADHTEALTDFCGDLLNALPPAQDDHCLKAKPDGYRAFLTQLTVAGCDATNLISD